MRFKYKVGLALMIGGLVPFLTIAKIDLDRLTSFARNRAETELENNVRIKAKSIEAYFEWLLDLTQNLAESPSTLQAIMSFDAASEALMRSDFTLNEAGLRDIYGQIVDRTEGGQPADVDRLLAAMDDKTRRMQQIYLVDSPKPLGQKHLVDNPGDNSGYTALHKKVHPYMHAYLERFGFYDLFLISPKDGRVVYTVHKESDFGTSLLTGPYANSAFGKAVAEMIKSEGKTKFQIVDFEAYEPSYNAQAGFILVPIKRGEEFMGILAAQVPLDFIAEMALARTDETQTGDAYIVGEDGRLRTPPRFGDGLEVGGAMPGDLAERAATSVLEVLETGNHLGKQVVAAHIPLILPGLRWNLVAEVNTDEAYAEATVMQDQALKTALMFAGAILVVVLVLSRWLLMPIRRLGRELQAQSQSAVAILQDASNSARSSAETMAQTAEESNQQSEQVKAGTRKMNENVTSVAAAVEELSASIREVVAGIQETSDLVANASGRAQTAAASLAELENGASRISGIVKLINDVANQTNLLALNAAVEASRAGEAGRGFAVVAGEIRSLAARTTQSTGQIAAEVKRVIDQVGENANAIRDISGAIARVNDRAHVISVSASQQGQVTGEIAHRMNEAAARVAESDDSMTEVQAASLAAAQAAGAVLASVVQVEQATGDIDASMAGFVARVQAL